MRISNNSIISRIKAFLVSIISIHPLTLRPWKRDTGSSRSLSVVMMIIMLVVAFWWHMGSSS